MFKGISNKKFKKYMSRKLNVETFWIKISELDDSFHHFSYKNVVKKILL